MKSLAHSALRALADGEFHSGEAIAQTAGMSRGSVWHAMRELEAAGLTVYKVRGRGYRLSQPVDLLDAGAVRMALGTHAADFFVDVVDAVESTNTALLRRAAAGAPHATVLAAEWQTAGRGRMGRVWQSGIGGGLTFSVLWRFEQGAGWLGGLSLAAGIACMRVLRRYGVSDAGLKWPNDVLWRGCKLAGILIEMHGDALGPSTAIIGMGVNVRLTPAVRDRIDNAAADLETACGQPVARNRLLADLLVELRAVLCVFARDGLAPLRDEWRGYHLYEARRVMVKRADGAVDHGIAAGIADDGALLLETPAGVQRYHSGEVSLRAAGKDATEMRAS
jgi:BirA family transcriptional regulator, biotin operon repressor / biotin---[acetyl-CoA-carboxylase] ligase